MTNLLRLWLRPLLAISVLGAASLAALGCSETEEAPVPAGGTIWQMQGSSCQDRTAHKLALSTVEEGRPVDRLLSDGSDGARVRCQVDSTRFSIAVSNATGALIASGTLSGNKSTDTTLTLSLPIGTYKNPTAQPCALDVVLNDGGKFIANYTCVVLDNTTNPVDTCEIKSTGASVVSYFSFENCSGF